MAVLNDDNAPVQPRTGVPVPTPRPYHYEEGTSMLPGLFMLLVPLAGLLALRRRRTT